MSEVSKRYASDETFREVTDLLFGGGYQPVRKMNPDGADLATKKDRRARKITAGLSATGAGAGALGLAVGAKAIKADGWKKTPRMTRALVPVEVAGLGGELMATHILHNDTKKKKIHKGIDEIKENASYGLRPKKALTQAAITSSAKAAGKGAVYVKENKGKLVKLPNKVETVNKARFPTRKPRKPGFFKTVKTNVKNTSANTESATHHLNQTAEHLNNVSGRIDRLTSKAGVIAGTGIAAGAGGVGYGVGSHKGRKKTVVEYVKKSDDLDIVWEGEISKVNTDKQQVFGWASIVELNGEPVVDLQGDYISIDEVEKSGYDYVKKSRKGGDMHLRDGDQPVHASDMIESFIVTPEKKQALGLPDEMPVGWWVGYQVNDPDVWAKVKSGERTGFSIHGRGRRS